MKPAQLVLILTFVIVALTVTVWLSRDQGRIEVVDTRPTTPASDKSELPIPESGPYGKAVIPELTFNFGSVETGNEGSHTFVIKNDGEGPLRLKTGKTSCGQCTFAQEGQDEIAPGKSGEVTIKWTVKIPNGKFRQTAEVFTTDPTNSKLILAIEGFVDSPIHLVPEGTWNLGDISDSGPTIAEGLLYSTQLDEIPIDRAECSSPLVTVAWEPADAIVLAEKTAKSGYKIKVTIAPGTSLGPVREHVKLLTTVGKGAKFEFDLVGRRPGSVEIKGRGWNPENNLILFGDIAASEGAKSKLMMYVRNFDGDLTAEQMDAENSRVKVQVAPTGKKFGKSKVYEVEVEVAPGVSERRRGKDAIRVVLKLNHPTVTEFKLFADFHAK